MLPLNLVAGIFFILLGLLVKRFPILIAGYNSSSVPEKRNIDEKALVYFVQILLFSMSALNVGFFFITLGLDWPESYGATFFKYTTIGIVIFGVLYLNLKKPHLKK